MTPGADRMRRASRRTRPPVGGLPSRPSGRELLIDACGALPSPSSGWDTTTNIPPAAGGASGTTVSSCLLAKQIGAECGIALQAQHTFVRLIEAVTHPDEGLGAAGVEDDSGVDGAFDA